MDEDGDIARRFTITQERMHHLAEALELMERIIQAEIARMVAECRHYRDLLEQVEAALMEGPLREQVHGTLVSLEKSLQRYEEGRKG